MTGRNWIEGASCEVIRNKGREIEMTLYVQEAWGQASLPQVEDLR